MVFRQTNFGERSEPAPDGAANCNQRGGAAQSNVSPLHLVVPNPLKGIRMRDNFTILALVGCPVKRAGLLQVVPCNT